MPTVPSLHYYMLVIRTGYTNGETRRSRYVVGAHSAADALVVAETTLSPGRRFTIERMQCLPHFPHQLPDHEQAELEGCGLVERETD